MLVLSRKKNEVIEIRTAEGKSISVMVVEIRGDKVRLGIEAEKDVTIHRKEVADAIRASQGKAVQQSENDVSESRVR